MAQIEILAIPSDAPGGLAAAPSAHYHSCHAFTLVTLIDGEVVSSRLLPRPVDGDDGRAAWRLADAGVTAIAATGIGARPLAHLMEVGIQPLLARGLPNVGAVVDAYLNGVLGAYRPEMAWAGTHDDDYFV
jgi:predicted Fe-Mo cluster-binding NifX family protein